MGDSAEQLRREIVELRRLLRKHEWAGLNTSGFNRLLSRVLRRCAAARQRSPRRLRSGRRTPEVARASRDPLGICCYRAEVAGRRATSSGTSQ